MLCDLLFGSQKLADLTRKVSKLSQGEIFSELSPIKSQIAGFGDLSIFILIFIITIKAFYSPSFLP